MHILVYPRYRNAMIQANRLKASARVAPFPVSTAVPSLRTRLMLRSGNCSLKALTTSLMLSPVFLSIGASLAEVRTPHSRTGGALASGIVVADAGTAVGCCAVV